MSIVVLYNCQAIYGNSWSCASQMSFIYVWGVLFGVITIGIFCWNGSLVALVLSYKHPTFCFTAGWVVSVPIRVGTFGLFCCAIIQSPLLAPFISFSLYVLSCSAAVIWCNWAHFFLIDFRYTWNVLHAVLLHA